LSVNETSEEETTEEVEEEIEVETTDSEYGRHDAQQFIKPTKRIKKTVLKKTPIKSQISKEGSSSAKKDETESLKVDKRKRKSLENDQTSKKAGSTSKADGKEYKRFRSDDCDSDYSNDVLDKVTQHKVCIYPGFNMSCHKFEANKVKNYLGNDFPAITFEKKCKDDKCYEFTVPLNSGYSIIKAIFKFAQLNPEIFAGMHPPTFINVRREK